MPFLIIDADNEIVTTEDGHREFQTKEDAVAFLQMLPIGWGAPLKIVTAEDWYKTD